MGIRHQHIFKLECAYEQGPCHKGDLLVVNPLTTESYCSCDPELLNQYFYPPLKLCYEHFTKVTISFLSIFALKG
jgi:hypothetical protein